MRFDNPGNPYKFHIIRENLDKMGKNSRFFPGLISYGDARSFQ
jgi:hypothetical protein